MAIVQISRIQHRRGRKNTGTGIPQLSSGELGWAVDAQELYIGNGAVSEGAPYVGNTRILTEHDNIFNLADQYSYKPSSNIWGVNVPVSRSLQERLDETVSVFSFGATGNGSDQTAEIQAAIDALFKTSNSANRVILWFPAGVYTVSSTIEVPPYAVIRGAGKEKTIFRSSTANVFKTVHYNPGEPTQPISEIDEEFLPQYIEISNVTIEVNSLAYKGIVVDSCRYSVFQNIKFKGVWDYNLSSQLSRAIDIISYTDAFISKFNMFDQLEIDNFNFGIYSDYNIQNNTFQNLRLENMVKGIAFGEAYNSELDGAASGPSYNLIQSSVFDNIHQEGIAIYAGGYNLSRDNKFYNVGNDQLDTQPSGGSQRSPVIKFNAKTNLSSSDFFERTGTRTPVDRISQTYLNDYLPEVSGRVNYSNLYGNEIPIGNTTFSLNTNPKILKFPVVENGTIFVDYVYTEDSEDIVREGTLELVINLSSNDVTLNDTYSFIGDNAFLESLTFSASIEGTANSKVVAVSATNDIPVTSDSFYYTIRVKS